MKRLLILFSCLVSLIGFLFWDNTQPETLPGADTAWHQYKRAAMMMLLRFKKDPYANNHIPLSKEKIDVIIVALEDDKESLSFVIDAARALIMHPIHKIYIVAKTSSVLENIALQKNCIFINEAESLPQLKNIHNISNSLKQEYIKLNANHITEPMIKNYVVLDAHTVLLQTQVFLKKDKQVLNACKRYSLAYKQNVQKLLQLKKHHNLGFTSHIMVFQKSIVENLKKTLEELHHLPWYEVISTESSACELYAEFLLSYHPNQSTIIVEKNLHLPKEKASGVEWQRGFLAPYYKSFSFAD